MKKTIKKCVKSIYKKYVYIRRRHVILKNIRAQLAGNKYALSQLTETQKAEIMTYWNSYGIKTSFEWHQLFYGITGKSDVRYIPEPIFHKMIKPLFNNPVFAGVWGDKSYTDMFIRDAKVVTSIVRNVHGRFLDGNFCLIKIEEASKIMQDYDALVIKPTTFTDTGKGVQLIRRPYDLKQLSLEYKENYVIQLPLKQHVELAKLNESSVNTIRVNSVLLGTEVHIMSAFVKVGQTGQFADNNGHERFFIGITKDGCFNDYAIDHDLNKYDKIPSGYIFSGQKVPSFDKICMSIEKAHKNIAHFGFAFWDVSVDESGEPVIVEVNLRHPDTVIAQATGTPFLGDYTDEILQYYMGKQK